MRTLIRNDRRPDDETSRARPKGAVAAALIAGRDDESRRWLGEGSPTPSPTACIAAGGEIVGWIDFDQDRSWLEAGEVNIGYQVFAPHRGRGYATRAVQLLMHHLAVATHMRAGALLIDPRNERSLAVARRAEFRPHGRVGDQERFQRVVPPLDYSDGVVRIRRQSEGDLEAVLAATDELQIAWLWEPGQREAWAGMTPDQQRDHALRWLRASADSFGCGPRWTFAVDAEGGDYVGMVECNLRSEHVPHGEANVSYASHPRFRGRGFVSRAVRLSQRFLRDHTGAREAHLVIDAVNEASLRVARGVGAEARERSNLSDGRVMTRHVLRLRDAAP